MKKYLIILALSLCIAFESFAQFSGFPGISGFPSIGSGGNGNSSNNQKKVGFEISCGFTNISDEYNGALGYSVGVDVKLGKFLLGFAWIENTIDPYNNNSNIPTFNYATYFKMGFNVYSKKLLEISANALFGSVAYSKYSNYNYGYYDSYSTDEEELIGAGLDCSVNLSKFMGMKVSFNATNVGFIMDTTAVIKF